MSDEFSFFMSGVTILLFVFATLLSTMIFIYFIDDDFIDKKKAVSCACISILILIADALLCYWVWG